MTDQRIHHPYPPTDPQSESSESSESSAPSASSAASSDDEPDRVVSDPVPVSPPSDQTDSDQTDSDEADSDHAAIVAGHTDRTSNEDDESNNPPAEDVTDQVPDEALEDRGAFDDPALADERTDPDDITAVTPPSTSDEPDRVDAAGPPVSDEPVAAETVVPAAAEAELLPGDVPAEPITALWGDEMAQSFRDRWRDVQLRFVDDPQGAAQEGKTLVADAVDSLTATLASQRDELSGWTSEEGNDTERFRVVVRQYRDFLDRLLGL